jgi:hypothetical protein
MFYTDVCGPRLDDKYIIPSPPRTEDLNTTRAPTPAIAVVRLLHLQQRLHLHPQSKRKKENSGSELNKIIDASTIGEKIMQSLVELSTQHVLAVAPNVVEYIDDVT